MAFLARKGSTHDEALLSSSIRIAVVGEPLVGKTSLTELIVTGHPAKSCRSTAGCHIHVKLVELPASAGGAAASAQPADAQRRFFVELWDVSGQPKYQQLRSVFYKQLNGVILVYDLSSRSSLTRLPKWASEVAREGTFVAPFADELAARNVGGLPVPVLIVGNKSDRLRGAADAGALSRLVGSACSQALAASGCSSWWARGLGGLRGRRTQSDAAIAPDAEQQVKGLTASAAAGQIDRGLLDAFLVSLWQRRFRPAAGGALELMHRTPSFSGLGGLGGGGGGGGALASSGSGQRLDDEWV